MTGPSFCSARDFVPADEHPDLQPLHTFGPQDHFGPIIYDDHQKTVVARIIIKWNYGPDTVEEYTSPTEARMRHANLKALLEGGVTIHVRSIIFEEVEQQ